jgi:UDP-N-acetylglucosamine 2-epimerase (non-hydrolysing)
MFILGTRPEAIKLAPIIKLADRLKVNRRLINTSQQRHLASLTLKELSLSADAEFNCLIEPRNHADFFSSQFTYLQSQIESWHPDFVVVQGDTNSALVGAQVSFLNKIPIAHVEAGLRTNNLFTPFPEEGNRRLISQIATCNFAPTQIAVENLKSQNIVDNTIKLVGNTIVDSLIEIWPHLFSTLDDFPLEFKNWVKSPKRGLLTIHRRENFGNIQKILKAIASIAEETDTHFILPVHTNPKVASQVEQSLVHNKHFTLLPPLRYRELLSTIKFSQLVITDSGGIQEEIASFGVPVMVIRESTERVELLQTGNTVLAGIEEISIFEAYSKIREKVSKAENHVKALVPSPFGDGKTSERIMTNLKHLWRENRL